MMTPREALLEVARLAKLALQKDLSPDAARGLVNQIGAIAMVQSGAAKRAEDRLAVLTDALNGSEALALRLRGKLSRLEPLVSKAATHQAAVADCQLWFDGFDAAFALREPWERPRTPDREPLRALNIALQAVAYPDAPEAELAF